MKNPLALPNPECRLRRLIGWGLLLLGSLLPPSEASADLLNANATSNNGGSSGWGIFFDVTSLGPALSITDFTTASTAAAGATFTLEIYTRPGSGLGGPVGTGPGSSPAGWTSLGTAQATQGAVDSGISLSIDIPDINVPAGSTLGVAIVFTLAGARYLGTGTPPLQNFSDANLLLTTGDARTAPFTTTGSFFSSRGLTGSLTYSVPEPQTWLLMALGGGALAGALRRRRCELARRPM